MEADWDLVGCIRYLLRAGLDRDESSPITDTSGCNLSTVAVSSFRGIVKWYQRGAIRMSSHQREPNLFIFAPGELSQDAVLCWLLSWADPQYQGRNPELHDAGCKLLAFLLRAHGVDRPPQSGITVHRQVNHADIVVEIGESYVLLIEDKTATKQHGDQLSRYLREIRKRYPGREVLPVFLKTGDQCDFRDVEADGYTLCNRPDILDCILSNDEKRIGSDILRNWAEYLRQKDQSIQAYMSLPVSDWDRAQWIGFYQELKKHLHDLLWDYVPNASGGFVGAWWGWQNVGRAELYLQIDERDLCFRIDTGRMKTPAAAREFWYRLIMEAGANSRSCKPRRPARFGNGRTMTVAVVPSSEWLCVDPNGLLDMQTTLRNLQSASSFLKRAVKPKSNARRLRSNGRRSGTLKRSSN